MFALLIVVGLLYAELAIITLGHFVPVLAYSRAAWRVEAALLAAVCWLTLAVLVETLYFKSSSFAFFRFATCATLS